MVMVVTGQMVLHRAEGAVAEMVEVGAEANSVDSRILLDTKISCQDHASAVK